MNTSRTGREPLPAGNDMPDRGITGTAAPLLRRVPGWLDTRILPLGLLVLLTGMLWAEERPEYHTLFYALVALPAFALLLARRDARDALLRQPVFPVFLAFAGYVMLSIAWSDTDRSLVSLLKRPLYIVLLFAAVMQVALAGAERLKQVLRLATVVASVAGAVSLVLFYSGHEGRFAGYRALSNPILTAHMFGFFSALCAAAWMEEGSGGRPWKAIAFALTGAVIVATGSRGGLAALAAAIAAAAAMTDNRRRRAIACAGLAAAACAAALAPEIITQRGLSLRPELWAATLREVAQRPWLGYGYDAYIMLGVPGVAEKFPNPHNMLLAVLRQQGIVGLALWLAMYAAALVSAWRCRRDPAVRICAVVTVSGFVASFTEGISYLSRPKEHWFLIWIPLALLAAALALHKAGRSGPPHRGEDHESA